jgi:hypothetical protein
LMMISLYAITVGCQNKILNLFWKQETAREKYLICLAEWEIALLPIYFLK